MFYFQVIHPQSIYNEQMALSINYPIILEVIRRLTNPGQNHIETRMNPNFDIDLNFGGQGLEIGL
jgi:hypothetical protein